ncbi:MAG: hypothetical protein F7C35_06025 [Desulfurococcales archaeon]|nr:hypothetical protein [Desulfurococcales archaeon]
MSRTLLVVSAPTVDVKIVGGRLIREVGGPALYAGAAASLLGWEVYAVGPIGHVTLETVHVEGILGIRRICCKTSSQGFQFELVYKADKRSVSLLSKGPPLGEDDVLEHIYTIRPDAVLVSPVYSEIPPQLPTTIYQRIPCTALDVQGYHRSGLKSALPAGSAAIVHGSPGELEGLRGDEARLMVETSGYGPLRVLARGRTVFRLRRPRGGLLEDPTGAGDVFTFILMTLICRGWGLVEAVEEASALVFELLPRVHEAIRSVRVS